MILLVRQVAAVAKCHGMKLDKINLFEEIETTIKALKPQTISKERKAILQPLIDFIQLKVSNIGTDKNRGNQKIRINFICTHNLRRSLLSQVWAQTMARYFHIPNVICYSGGTESTALFPTVVETLRNSGFQIQTIAKSDHPIYSIKYADNEHPIIGFSKTIDNDFNPKTEFAAIMTCDSAMEACPIVFGSEIRIPIMYEDPKFADNTPQQAEKYQERSLQIANELYYVFSQINP